MFGAAKMSPEEYIRLFETRTKAPAVEGICTRIIRVADADHRTSPRRLSGDDSNRKIVFVSNAAASAKLLGKSGFECLLQIGYPEDWIRHDLLPPGPRHRNFEMTAFPAASCKPARWKEFLELVAAAYPEVQGDCEQYVDQLAALARSGDRGWAHFNSTLGFDMAAQENGGAAYMSVRNYLESPRSLAHFRAFLAHTCYANRLFSGDGYTYNDAGERQAEEFVMADAAVGDIKGAAFCAMDVVAPPAAAACCVR